MNTCYARERPGARQFERDPHTCNAQCTKKKKNHRSHICLAAREHQNHVVHEQKGPKIEMECGDGIGGQRKRKRKRPQEKRRSSGIPSMKSLVRGIGP